MNIAVVCNIVGYCYLLTMKPYKGIRYAILMDKEWIHEAGFLIELKSHQIDRWLRSYAKENGLDWQKLIAVRKYG